MGKFKLSDKVRLRKDVVVGNSYNGITLTDFIYEKLENLCLIVSGYSIKSNNVLFVIPGSGNGCYVGEDALELFQEKPHIYKVGDKVRIKEREGKSYEYPYCFTTIMAKQKGKIFTIKEIIKGTPTCNGNKYKFYNGDDNIYLFEEDANCFYWDSSMFEPVIEKENTDYNLGDSIKVLEYSGRIAGSVRFYVNFYTPGMMHSYACSKIKEKYSDFCKIAKNMGAIEVESWFPEFPTIEKLVAFVNKINELYSQKPSGESTQVLITQKTKEHEIRFQKPKASYIRGNVPTGRAICGRGNKTAIELGHLSNKACYF